MSRCFYKKIFLILFILMALGNSANANNLLTDNEISAINVLNGNYVCSINDAYQERYFKANIIKNLNRDVGVIALGSSHLMTLSGEAVFGDYINLSLGGASLQDRLNILGLLDLYNVKYKKIIYEMDITSFLDTARDEKPYNIDFNKYGDYFYKKLMNEDGYEKPSLDFNDSYTNAFSDVPEWNLLNVYNEKNLPYGMVYYAPDAAQGYPKEVYSLELENTKNHQQGLIGSDKAVHDKHIFDESREITDALMKYFYDNNIEVVIVAVPRSPFVYDGSSMSTSEFILDINKLIYKYYTNYNVKCCGSFSPYDMNIVDTDYYDALHLKPEVINHLYIIK